MATVRSAERQESVTIVGVTERIPLFRHGIVAALLERGLEVETPSDVVVWASEDISRVVLLTLRQSIDWDALARLGGARVRGPVVAILFEPTPASYRHAIRAGASSAVPESINVAEIAEVVLAAASGRAVFPADIVGQLVASADEDPSGLEPPEISWIQALAGGETVASLAFAVGYSEREMYRRLARIYKRLGARSRTEALVIAGRLGVIP